MNFTALLALEERRILSGINLIASENYPSKKVRAALSSIAMSKYAEGYPKQRYYAGCDVVDEIEAATSSLACQLFGAAYANVQPHAGTQANQAVLQAFLAKGDVVLALSLSCGGHFSHGHKANFSGRDYQFYFYAVNEQEILNYQQLENLAQKHKPKLIIAGASAYPRMIDFARIADIARSVGAKFMVDMAHPAGMVAAKLLPSPLPHADVVTLTTHKTLRGPRGAIILARAEFAKLIDRALMPGVQGGAAMNSIAAKGIALQEASLPEFACYQEQVLQNAQTLATTLTELGYHLVTGGTDTHMLLINLPKSTALKAANDKTGVWAEKILEKYQIFVNRNLVPFDSYGPLITSGIRLGTAALTTLGATSENMRLIGQIIHKILSSDPANLDESQIKSDIQSITANFNKEWICNS